MKNNANNTYTLLKVFTLLSIGLVITSFIPVEKNNAPVYQEKTFNYIQDGDTMNFTQVLDSSGWPIYYYRRINQYPCQTEKVCRIMRLTMYWDSYGNYLKYELDEKETLTKLDHKEFNEKDYKKLHKILNNPKSELKWCDYDALTYEQCENQYHLDAVTGATNPDVAFEYINGAIKTTYALWKIANGSITDSIRQVTGLQLNYLLNINKNNIAADSLTEIDLITQYHNSTPLHKYHYLHTFGTYDTTIADTTALKLLTATISSGQPVLYAGILNLVQSDNMGRNNIKNVLVPELEAQNTYWKMLSYNAIERSGFHNFIKKQPIYVWKGLH